MIKYFFIFIFLTPILAQNETNTTRITTTRTTSTTTRKNDCLELFPYCVCLGGPLVITCYNFTDFTQLNFTLFGEVRNISRIDFSPRKALILDDSLNLDGIELNETAVFNNLKGIDLTSNPFYRWTPENNLSLQIFSSNFNETFDCDESVVSSDFRPIFSSFKTVEFGYRNNYKVDICPLLFWNASITYFNVSSATFDNYPTFSDLKNFDTIHAKIETLYFNAGTQAKISKELLSRLVFEKLNTILIWNTLLRRIEDETFKEIHNLRFLNFSITNFDKFFYNSTNKWMKDLNSRVKVNYSDPQSLKDNRNNSLLVNLNPLYSAFFFDFNDTDLEYFQFFPHDNFVFARISHLYPLKCSKSLQFLLKNARYYPFNLTNVNTTATSLCLSDAPTTPKPSSTIKQDFCRELNPYCNCYTSSVIINCDNFDDFSQLNFTRLRNFRKRIFELVLFPKKAIPLDNRLNLNGVEVYDRITLRRINGFDLNANPFDSIKNNNDLNLYMYDINLKTTNKACNPSQLNSNYASLFSSFKDVFIYNSATYDETLCPLMFLNANIRQLEIYNLTWDNTIKFSKLTDSTQLNSTILNLRVNNAKNLILSPEFLNSDVFSRTQNIDFDDIEFHAITELTFRGLTQLRTIQFILVNMKDFFTLSENKWMSGLNWNVKVNYSNQQEINNFRDKSLLLTFNSKNGQSYNYSNADKNNFKYFPHDNFVFVRILADDDLECTDTLKFLLKNALYYPTISILNTTSSYNCLLVPSSITTITAPMSTSIITTSTTTARTTTTTSQRPTSIVNSTTTTSSSTTALSTTNLITNNSSTISLGAFLGTILPIFAVLIVSLLCLIVLWKKYKIIENSVKPSDVIQL